MVELFRAFPVLVAASLVSAVFALLASRNMTDEGKKSGTFTPFLWRGREHLTDRKTDLSP